MLCDRKVPSMHTPIRWQTKNLLPPGRLHSQPLARSSSVDASLAYCNHASLRRQAKSPAPPHYRITGVRSLALSLRQARVASPFLGDNHPLARPLIILDLPNMMFGFRQPHLDDHLIELDPTLLELGALFLGQRRVLEGFFDGLPRSGEISLGVSVFKVLKDLCSRPNPGSRQSQRGGGRQPDQDCLEKTIWENTGDNGNECSTAYSRSSGSARRLRIAQNSSVAGGATAGAGSLPWPRSPRGRRLRFLRWLRLVCVRHNEPP